MALALLLVPEGVKAQQTVYIDDGFETWTPTSSADLPTGWSKQDYTAGGSSTTSINSYLWQVGNASGYAHTGSQYAYLFCNHLYTASSRLKTPAISLSGVKDAKVSFWLRNGSSGGDFSLYVSTDGGTTYSTNALVQHVNTGMTYTYYEYSLSQFKGQTINLVFEGASSGTEDFHYYLDDLKVAIVSNCQAPASLTISNLTDSSATLSWATEVNIQQQYPDNFRIIVKSANGNTVFNDTLNGMNTTLLLTNLTQSTSYRATIVSHCDVRNFAGYSDSVSIEFKTLAEAINPPFVQNFDNITDLTGNYYLHNASLNITPAYSHSSANSVTLTTSATDYAYIAFPLMNIAANDVEMDFWIRRATAATSSVGTIQYKVGYLTDPTDFISYFVPVYYDSLTSDAAWRNIRFNTFAQSDTVSPIMLCVQIDAAYATSVYVDDVDIHVVPSCIRPENVTAANIAANSITLSWNMSNAQSYMIKARATATSTVTTQTATQSPYTFTGLNPNTEYEFTVQGICSASDSSEVSRAVQAKTLCGIAASTIFIEGAETTTGTALPECWSTDHLTKTYTGTAAPFVTSTSTKRETRGFMMTNMNAGNISYLCTPALNFDSLDKYSLRFEYYRPSGTTATYDGEGLKVFVTPTPGNLANAIEVIPFINRLAGLAPATTTTGWNTYEGIINYQGIGYVMFVGYSQNGAALYFDNVEVFYTPSCPKVTDIAIANNALHSVDLTWDAGLHETQWVVDYQVMKGIEVLKDTSAIATSTTYTIAGLPSSAALTITGNVRALCNAGDTADAVSFNFSTATLCEDIAVLPYFNDFESEATGVASKRSTPVCWSQFNDATGASYVGYPYIYSNTTYATSGSKMLYFYSATGATYAAHQMAILPKVDTTAHAINTLRLKFWAKRSTTTSQGDAHMHIGVMSDPTNITTFVPVDTILVNNTDAQEFVIPFDNYSGNGAYVAILMNKEPKATYCYIDDVTLEEIPDCIDLNGSATVSGITHSSATINLQDATAYGSWSYAFAPSGTPVGEMTAVDTMGQTIVLNGLPAATAYDLYVRRNCGDTSYSPWSRKIVFATTEVPATIPYVCGFEDDTENSHWQYLSGKCSGNRFVIGSASSAIHTGSRSIYVSNDNGVSNVYTTAGCEGRFFAYRTIRFEAKGYQIEYDWRCPGGEGSTYVPDYGRVFLVPVEATLTATGSYYPSYPVLTNDIGAGFPEGAIYLMDMDSSSTFFLSDDNWHHISKYLDMTLTPGIYNLVLAWNNDNSSSTGSANGPLAVDDIKISEFSCIPPSTVNITNVTSTSVILNVSQPTETQWEFVLDTLPFSKYTVPAAPLARMTSTDGNAAITGLTPNTEYYYTVRTICGDGDTSIWLAPSSLRTACAPYAVPYYETFERSTSAYCWTVMPGSAATASIGRSLTYRKNGYASLMAVKASAVSPEYSVDSLTHYMINGWAYATTANTSFGIGVISDPNDVTTYTNISNVTIQQSNKWTEFTAYFTDLMDPDNAEFKNAKNIVLACGVNTIYFDDIRVELTPTCPKPTEVEVTNVTAHSFDISFVNNSTATQWVVYANGVPYQISTNPATISGLAAATNYEISIAAACSATDTSHMTEYGVIRTLCDKLPTPWVCGFETADGYTGGTSYNVQTTANFAPGCWNVLNQKTGHSTYPNGYVSTSTTYVHSGTQGVYTYTSSAATKNFFMVLPEFEDSANMLKVSLWYKNSSTAAAYADLVFGYFNGNVDENNFVAVKTFPKSATTSTWTEGVVMTNTAGYNIPGNARIGFKIDRKTSGGGIYIDDVSVCAIRDCSDPGTPTVSEITSNSAKVTFTDANTAHTSWQYVYGPTVGFDPLAATPVTIDTTSFVLTGLRPESNVKVYVRAICDSNNVSNYMSASFATLCAPFVVTSANPFVEDFNDYNYGQRPQSGTCMIFTNVPSGTSYQPQIYPTSAPSTTSNTDARYGHEPDIYDRCLYWYIYSTSLTNGSVLRQFHLEGGKVYEIAAWVRNGLNATNQTRINTVVGKTLSLLDTIGTITVDGESNSSRIIGGRITYCYNELYKRTFAMFTPDTTGDFFIGFNASISNTLNNTYLYLDDWTIKAYEGCTPAIATVDNVTATSASISVTDTSFYQLEYVLNDTTAVPTVVNNNTFTIDSLNSATDYTLYLRKYCSATSHSEWVYVTFQTNCGVISTFPYNEGFEGTSFPPICWSRFNYGASESLYNWQSATTSTMVKSGQKSAFVSANSNNAKAVLVTGEFNLNSPTGYYVRLSAYRSAAASAPEKTDEALHIGYLNAPIDVTNIATVNEIGVIHRNPTNPPVESNVEAAYYEYEFEVPATVTGPTWFSFDFHSQYGGNFAIDDITIEPIPTCVGPKSAPVVSSRTMTTTTLSVDMNNKPMAEVAWSLANAPDSIIGSIMTNNGNAIATGLSANTTYFFKYRFICDSTDFSRWSPIVRGTTTVSDCFAPQNLRTFGITNDHRAGFTWGMAPEAVGYQYELKQGIYLISSASITGDSIQFDTLAANTDYTFRVRTICSLDTSAWQSIDIKTTNPCYTLPFVCGFENDAQNSRWQIYMLSPSGDNSFMIGNGVSRTGSKALYVSNNMTSYDYSTNSSSVTEAEVLVEIPAGNYYISYDWNGNGEDLYDFGRLFLIPSTVAVSGSSYSSFNISLPVGAIALDNGNRLNLADDWSNYSQIFTITTGNVYKLVAVWANNSENGTTPPFAIDNIRIEEVTCMPVNSVSVIDVNPNDAKAVVAPYSQTTAVEYALTTEYSEDSIASWSVATGDTIRFNRLLAGTRYYVYVRHACSASDHSPARVTSFLTPNNAVTLPFVATFEANDTMNQHWVITAGTATNFFTIGSGTSNQGARSLYVTNDGSTYAYTTSGAASWSYAYIPLAVPAGTLDVTYQWRSNGESNADYGRIFLAPANMVPEDNVQLGNMTSSSTPAGAMPLDAYYGKLNLSDNWVDAAVEVPVAKAGTYNLIIAWRNNGSAGAQSPLAIDNIKIKLITCPKIDVANVSIDSVSTDMLRVKVTGNNIGAGVIYHLASDASFTDTVAYGMTLDSLITVNGLATATWYNARLWSYCSEGDTSSVVTTRFRTACGINPYYVEDFENFVASSTERTQLTDNCWLVDASASAYHYVSNTMANVHAGGKSLYIYNTSTTGSSQTFGMPMLDTLAGKRLTMWYKNHSTTYSANYAVLEVGYMTDPDDETSFVNLYTAPYQSVYTKLTFDYPTTVPANARPAFRANGTYSMCVDDIRIIKMVQGPTYNDVICFGSAYNVHGFNCAAGSLAPGDTTLTTIVPATEITASDTMITANVRVLAEIYTTFTDTVCAGQPYTRGLFNITSPETRTYYHTFQNASVMGCDSSVTLNLYVIATTETRFDTICQGDSILVGDQYRSQSGDYVYYTFNALGCNDTVTLHLNVVDTAQHTYIQVCANTPYTWEGQTYTQSGTYTKVVPGIAGCSLTKYLHLTVMPTDSTISVAFCQGGSIMIADTVINTPGLTTFVRLNQQTGCYITYHVTATQTDPATEQIVDNACEDKPYTGYGIMGEVLTADSTVTMNLRTADGKCDSILTVVITLNPTVYGTIENITVGRDEVYTWHDNTYTETGVYYDTLPAANGCDSICTLNLTVGTAVDNVEMLDVTLVPNPVNAGETSFIYGNFGDVKSVEILNSFGQVVDTFVPAGYPIEVQGLNASGIYYVRVTTADDRVAVQKLIVK